MRWEKMFALVSFMALGLVALPMLAREAVAFEKVWRLYRFLNVTAGEASFYDDVPCGERPGWGYWPHRYQGTEAGFFSFLNNQSLDETAGAYTTTGLGFGLGLDGMQLEARVAVSDSSFFRIGYGTSETSNCQYWPSALIWLRSSDAGLYVMKAATVSFPYSQRLRKVCILLSDTPDGVRTGRTHVLIDYIRLRHPKDNWTYWIENFNGYP